MSSEKLKVKKLFEKLCKQPLQQFPSKNEKLEAPAEQGVYIIRKGKIVLHVGRTTRAKSGIYQRLKNHLHGQSSFTWEYLIEGDGNALRKGHTFQYLVEKDNRQRALLEAFAIGTLCPEHLGLGKKRRKRH